MASIFPATYALEKAQLSLDMPVQSTASNKRPRFQENMAVDATLWPGGEKITSLPRLNLESEFPSIDWKFSTEATLAHLTQEGENAALQISNGHQQKRPTRQKQKDEQTLEDTKEELSKTTFNGSYKTNKKRKLQHTCRLVRSRCFLAHLSKVSLLSVDDDSLQ